MSKAIVITSGGLDSTTAVYWTRRYHDEDPMLLSFDYGQRHVKELQFAIETAERLGCRHDVIDLTSVTKLISSSALVDLSQEVPEGHYSDETMKATVVPNRNMMMLSIAYAVAVSDKREMVVAGMHAGDHAVYPDCREEFIRDFNWCAGVANEGFGDDRLAVVTPFINVSKADIVVTGQELGVPFELTWSCYKGGRIHCGRCSTCVERIEAFDLAGVEDPTEYEDSDYWKGVVETDAQ